LGRSDNNSATQSDSKTLKSEKKFSKQHNPLLITIVNYRHDGARFPQTIQCFGHPMRDFDVNIAKGLIGAAPGADGFSSLYFTCPRNLNSSNEQATAQLSSAR
jgi:hypothetical protein